MTLLKALALLLAAVQSRPGEDAVVKFPPSATHCLVLTTEHYGTVVTPRILELTPLPNGWPVVLTRWPIEWCRIDTW